MQLHPVVLQVLVEMIEEMVHTFGPALVLTNKQ